MQIPGLNLLNGTSVPTTAPNDLSRRETETDFLFFTTREEVLENSKIPSENHDTSGADQQYGDENSEENLNAASKEESIVERLAEMLPDPLDIALEADSDDSSAKSEADKEQDSDDASSSSSDSEDDGFSDIIKTAQIASLEELDEDGDDMEDVSATKQTGMRTKNEVIEDNGPVKLMDISIGPTTLVECLGTVEKVIDSIAIVKAHTDGEYRILDEGAFVFTDARQLAGTISETFGPVKEPRYVIRLSENVLQGEVVLVDRMLFYIPDQASYVFTQSLRGNKGSDASNIHDEEVHDEEREFSDDEAEMEYRRCLKRKRGQETDRRRNKPGQDTGMKSHDDVSRGLSYRPLSRPTVDLSTRDTVSARAILDHPPNRRNFERGQRPSHEFYNMTSITPALQSSKINQFPSQPFPTYPAPISRYQLSTTQPVDGHSDVGGYLSIPPGTYVNPAFFNRANEPGLPTSTNLPQDVQIQMDILNNLRRYTNG